MKRKLPKIRRISHRSEIRSLLHTGSRWRSRGLSIIFRENDRGWNRMAVLVSRHHGNAVARNRLKRKIREVFRQKENIVPPFYDILIRPHYHSSHDFSELCDQFEEWSRKVRAGAEKNKPSESAATDSRD